MKYLKLFENFEKELTYKEALEKGSGTGNIVYHLLKISIKDGKFTKSEKVDQYIKDWYMSTKEEYPKLKDSVLKMSILRTLERLSKNKELLEHTNEILKKI